LAADEAQNGQGKAMQFNKSMRWKGKVC